MADKIQKAYLYAKEAPSKEQFSRFQAFVHEKYGEDVVLEFRESEDFEGGFALRCGAEAYDWSNAGLLKQFKAGITHISETRDKDDIIPLIRDSLKSWTPAAMAEEVGTVRTVGDGIVNVEGLRGVTYGEILLFDEGIRGMALDLRPDATGCILFDDDGAVRAGSHVSRTGKTAGIPVGECYLGRVVNALGVPVDGLGPVSTNEYRAIESPAPGIIDRQPVNKPLETGILAIDSMFPIGRGQRELIIGDRQTGKTAIAVDTILNQKGKGVVCIYVAIGQKSSLVSRLVETLRKNDAMDYTVVVNAPASDTAALQYIAPYAGCALGEYFMNRGQDVLIVYDDLSKHAVAYRSISLLLERAPGREAYPGDVFYLHSRLLERSAHLSNEKGGGSMTALPIVETLEGDVSAYIPTNIISITDGQIFLESDLFLSGQRPAINVGLSVSRVGGDAQTKAMKKSAGSIRIDLAQYREMEVFTQFTTDMDEATKNQIRYGNGIMEMLKQPQSKPYSQHEEVILLVASQYTKFKKVPEKRLREYINGLLEYFDENERDLQIRIDSLGIVSTEDRDEITRNVDKYTEEFIGGGD